MGTSDPGGGNAHPSTVGGLFAGALLAAALLSIRVQVQTYQDSDPGYTLPNGRLVLLVTLVGTVVLVARRRIPLTVLGVTAVALIGARLIESSTSSSTT